MIIGTLMALETCLILGQVSHNLLYSKKKLLTDTCGPGERLTRKQLTSRPDHLWPELWKSMGKNAKLKEKQKWSEEQLHLEHARKLRGIYFIDPEDTEFKETIKNARKKLETSVAPAMPCKIAKNCGSGASNKIQTKLACILEADDSTRMSMGNAIPQHHVDHIAGKGENSLQHNNLVHKFIPVPQAMKIPAAKAAVDKEWEKLEKISAWNLTKVKSKKEVIDEARTSGAKVHFASLMDICHLKNAELEAKHQKYKGRVVLRGDIVKDDVFLQENEEFIYPIADGRIKNSRRRSGTENIHLDTAASNSRRKSRRFSWRIRRVSSTSRLISGCRWSNKRFLVHVRKLQKPPSCWTQSRTLLAERRIIPYSTVFYWRSQNYKNKFGCYARTPHRWLLEYRWVKRFVWFLDRFHSVYYIRKTSRRIYVVREETDKTAGNIQARSFTARALQRISKKC